MNLIKVSRIRSLAEKMCVTRIHEDGGKVIFNFAQANGLKPQAIAAIVGHFGPRLFIHGGVKPFLRLTPDKKNRLGDIQELLQMAVDANTMN
jgi:transcription-repair coupling factor (superfamily II helicase)